MRDPGWRRSRRGAMLTLLAFMMIVVLVMSVFSTDVAYMQLTRTELRTATDAAARAGSEALSRTQSEPAARSAAKEAAARNRVAGAPLLLDDADILFGTVDLGQGAASIKPGDGPGFRAVRVLGRRSSTAPSGEVTLLLGGILGTPSFAPHLSATSVTLDRDLCLVVDRSGSMNNLVTRESLPSGADPCEMPHPTLSKWAGLRLAVDAFVAELTATTQAEQLALVTYSSAGTVCGRPFTDADLEQPLDGDYAPTISAMNRLSSQPIGGRTNITAGLELGIQALTDVGRSRPFARRTLVLMTDGLHNTGPSPESVVPRAVAAEIQVHTITFGHGADQAGMQRLASLANGQHYHAPDAVRLQQIFREIARTLPVILTE